MVSTIDEVDTIVVPTTARRFTEKLPPTNMIRRSRSSSRLGRRQPLRPKLTARPFGTVMSGVGAAIDGGRRDGSTIGSVAKSVFCCDRRIILH
jgi:hypothetical protein